MNRLPNRPHHSNVSKLGIALGTNQEEYLTVFQVGERLGYAPGTIRNFIHNGTFKLNIHYVKPTKRKVLFKWSQVEAWLYGEINDDSWEQGERCRIRVPKKEDQSDIRTERR